MHGCVWWLGRGTAQKTCALRCPRHRCLAHVEGATEDMSVVRLLPSAKFHDLAQKTLRIKFIGVVSSLSESRQDPSVQLTTIEQLVEERNG